MVLALFLGIAVALLAVIAVFMLKAADDASDDASAAAATRKGTYPFVSHAFAHVDLGQVGILKVGNPTTTMSH